MARTRFLIAKYPWQTWVGLGMVTLFWYLNWGLSGLRTHWAFFPLWLGYIFFLDGLVYRRTGASPFRRSFWRWIGYFIISAPVWWIFEWVNIRVGYWDYQPIETFSEAAYVFYCTINFSIVIPAVFTTAEWLDNHFDEKAFTRGPVIGSSSNSRMIVLALGVAMLAATLIWPAIGSPLIWISLFLILDPINHFLGFRSILSETAERKWRTVVILFLASLICGFFWELWNFYSLPKWIYHVPYVDFWHVFEMPALGYLGYLPFGLELFAMYHFIVGVLGGIPHIKLDNNI